MPHIVRSLQKFYKDNPTIRLDGEIYNHEYREDFNALMSIARKQKPNKEDLELSEEKLEYHVYDLFDSSNPQMTALDRKYLIEHIVSTGFPYVETVDWEIVHNEAELTEVKKRHLLQGYEGTIIRTIDQPYFNKRTKHLMKIKEFVTEEFPAAKHCIVEGKGNKSGMAGNISVMVDSVKVDCGIRGSWKYCEELFKNKDQYEGATITVRHFGKTLDGSLRFPVCIDINRPD